MDFGTKGYKLIRTKNYIKGVNFLIFCNGNDLRRPEGIDNICVKSWRTTKNAGRRAVKRSVFKNFKNIFRNYVNIVVIKKLSNKVADVLKEYALLAFKLNNKLYQSSCNIITICYSVYRVSSFSIFHFLKKKIKNKLLVFFRDNAI